MTVTASARLPRRAPRRGLRARLRQALVALVAVCLAALAPGGVPAAQAAVADMGAAAAQTLTWTGDDSITEYASAPSTAVAGETTIVFENSAATGNTSGMVHTLTFDTSTEGYNHDVSLNLQASPNDENGGRWEATVTLTPGKYRYFCAIPGHGEMWGELIVTDGSGEDTTPPEASHQVTGEQNDDGAYLGSATVELAATDDMSGVDRVDYALDGATDWTAYEAPVVVNTVGEHTLRYRATDKAGNTSEEKSVAFTVVEAPADTVPPTVTASVGGEQNDDGAYLDMAMVTLTAADTGGSGVDKVEWAANGGAFTAYTEPIHVHTIGEHTISYRATDRAGNSSEVGSVTFKVVEKYPNPDPVCPEIDSRPIVFIGELDTHVPNRVTSSGCTINEVIEDEQPWTNHAKFMRHVKEVTARLYADAVINSAEREMILQAAKASDIGRSPDGYTPIFTGTETSFSRWEHVGGGSFHLNAEEGSMTSGTTTGGLGMLWYPRAKFADFSLKLQWRDDAPGDGRANSGVFVRFPWVHGHPDESRPEWVAIKYGHEVQVLDREDGDQYKTGSVYGFDLMNHGQAGVTPKGTWNDYEIKVVDQHYWIYRNGILINEFENAPGQLFSPPRADDPGTDGRQHAEGYVGLQVHGTTDVVSFRNIRIKPL